MFRLASFVKNVGSSARRLNSKYLEWRVRQLRHPSLMDRWALKSSWRGWWIRVLSFYGTMVFIYYFFDIYIWISKVFFNQEMVFGEYARGKLILLATPMLLFGTIAFIVGALKLLNKDNE